LLILFIAGLLFGPVCSLLPTLPLYIEDVGATKQQIGFVGLFCDWLLLFRSFGAFADQHSRKIVLLIGMAAVAIAMGYMVVKSIPLLMVIGRSTASVSPLYHRLTVRWLQTLPPQKNRGEVIGYMSLETDYVTSAGDFTGWSWLHRIISHQLDSFVGFVLPKSSTRPPLIQTEKRCYCQTILAIAG